MLSGIFVPAAAFSLLMVFLNGAFGLYRHDQSRLDFWVYFSRLFFAMLIGAPVAYWAASLLPGGGEFRSTLPEVALVAFCGLVLLRQIVLSPLTRMLMPRRVLVLGTGTEAKLVESSLGPKDPPGVHLVGFYPLDKLPECVVSPARIIERVGSLEDVVRKLGVQEVIVAVREQRGGVLPLRELLNCRIGGVNVTDLAGFFERVHGQIPVDSLKASWLIYGSGFRQTWLRSLVKRVFDIVVSVALLIITLPIAVLTAFLIAVESGAPIIFRQERVGLHGKTFHILKFRSMRRDAEEDGRPRWASIGDARVTSLGRVLRRSRIDELPQLINVLKGEMSFVGPRPERPAFVSMLTDQVPFYAVRHSVKPGITGWAQVRYSYGATMEQSVRKLEYDLYYVKNHSLFLDLVILFETTRVVLFGEGAR